MKQQLRQTSLQQKNSRWEKTGKGRGDLVKSFDCKVSLFLAGLSFIAGVVILPYQLEVFQATAPALYNEILETLPMSLRIVSIMVGLQLFITAFLLSLIGIKLARKTGLSFTVFESIFCKGKVVTDKKAAYSAIMGGVFLGFMIVGSDRFYFRSNIDGLVPI